MSKLFISYKSENANIVRRVVELLIATGVDVWFAEYEVLSGNYDDFDKNLDPELSLAIQSSSHALIFTNSVWNESAHCQGELREIMDHIPIGNVIQICIPKETGNHIDIQSHPAIATLTFEPDKIVQIANYVIDKIGHSTRFESDKYYCPGSNENQLEFRYGNIDLGLFHWRKANPKLGLVGQEHELLFGGRFPEMKYATKFEINIDPYNSMIANQEYMFDKNSPSGHRDIYKLLMKRAKKWYKKHDLDEGGLHLYWFGNRSHVGLTYKTQLSRSHCWTRICSLTFKDAEYGKTVTCTFELKAYFDGSQKEKSFKIFCGLIHYFDQIVESFQYKIDPCLKYLPDKTENIISKYSWYLLGVIGMPAYYLWTRHSEGISGWVLAAISCVGLFVGFITGQLLEYKRMFPYLECLKKTSGIKTTEQGELSVNQHLDD